jgi:hypothetical protein
LFYVCCSDFYEPGAFLMEDEGTVIAGLLVGLNVIDCNLGIKDEDLDQPVCILISVTQSGDYTFICYPF